jgi:hypothetical protein
MGIRVGWFDGDDHEWPEAEGWHYGDRTFILRDGDDEVIAELPNFQLRYIEKVDAPQ